MAPNRSLIQCLIAFQTWRTAISDYLQASPTSTSFIAGGVAGAISRTIVSPLERMKILFQIQGPGQASYAGVWSTLGKMWKEEGWRGFMRGNGTNCIRIVPYSACQFAAYTTYKRVIPWHQSLPEIPLFFVVLAVYLRDHYVAVRPLFCDCEHC